MGWNQFGHFIDFNWYWIQIRICIHQVFGIRKQSIRIIIIDFCTEKMWILLKIFIINQIQGKERCVELIVMHHPKDQPSAGKSMQDMSYWPLTKMAMTSLTFSASLLPAFVTTKEEIQTLNRLTFLDWE